MSNQQNNNAIEKQSEKRIITKSDKGTNAALYNGEAGVFFVLDSWDGNPGSFLLQDEHFSIAETDEFATHIVASVDATALG